MDSARTNWKDKIKQDFRISGYVFYLGFALGLADLSYADWQFWVILIPTIILVNWKRQGE